MKNAPRSKKAAIGRPFLAGNPGGPGRPRGPGLSQRLLEAIQSVEARHRKPLLEHFVERAYTSDRVLIALLKKLIPDLGQQEVNLRGEDFDAATQELVALICKYVPDPAARQRLTEELRALGDRANKMGTLS